MARSLLPSLFGINKTNHPNFHNLPEEIERAFNELRRPFSQFDQEISVPRAMWLQPKIDVSETDEAIEIVADVPGVKEEDIDVTVTNNVLVIKGEKAEEREEKKKDYHLVERSRGSYMRSIPLGFNVREEDVKATFDTGVLKIFVTKPEDIQARTKKIRVTKPN